MENNIVSQWLGSLASLGAIIASYAGWVPSVAALLALIWYIIQIKESDTVRAWQKRRMRYRLEYLHQEAARLEMKLVDVSDATTMDHLKKMIGMRVDIDAGLRERELNHEHANEIATAVAKEHQRDRDNEAARENEAK